MNPPQKIMILALVFLSLLAGCGMVNVDVRGYDGAPRYAEVDPAGVEILRAPPQGPHERLGDIYIEPKGTPSKIQIFIRLKLAASRMGADAVVLVADKAKLTEGPVADPQWWNRQLPEGSDRTIVGVAIWYPGRAPSLSKWGF